MRAIIRVGSGDIAFALGLVGLRRVNPIQPAVFIVLCGWPAKPLVRPAFLPLNANANA